MKIVKFFDKLEDYIREGLSKYPIFYAIAGGFSMILLWRSVWHTADILHDKGGFLGWFFYEPNQIVINTAILLALGLFVAGFIGDSIIMSGIKKEKKIAEKTELEVKDEAVTINEVMHEVKSEAMAIREIIREIKDLHQTVDELKKKSGLK